MNSSISTRPSALLSIFWVFQTLSFFLIAPGFTLNMADALSSGPPSSKATTCWEDKSWQNCPFLCNLLFPHHFVYWGDNLDHLLQIYHPVTIHIVHPEPSCENIWQSKSSEANAGHLNAHCSFSFGLPPEVTSIANRNSLKSMKLFWSLSKVLKPKGC